MFGNLITSRQLKTLCAENSISIEPFAAENLKATHYTLNPGRVLKKTDQGDWDTCFTFSARRPEYVLSANEYAVIEVRQNVKIYSDGIVGRFVTTSTNIENGWLVLAGQIDSKYGVGGEALRFGLKNLLPSPTTLRIDSRLAHVEFFDLRGIVSEAISKSATEQETWHARRRGADWEQADSDGVKY